MDVRIEKKKFLNNQEKILRNHFMYSLMTSFSLNIDFCYEILNDSNKNNKESLSDIILSVLIMFIRESFLHFIGNSNLANDHEMLTKMLNEYFSEIKNQIFEQLKKEQESHSTPH